MSAGHPWCTLQGPRGGRSNEGERRSGEGEWRKEYRDLTQKKKMSELCKTHVRGPLLSPSEKD